MTTIKWSDHWGSIVNKIYLKNYYFAMSGTGYTCVRRIFCWLNCLLWVIWNKFWMICKFLKWISFLAVWVWNFWCRSLVKVCLWRIHYINATVCIVKRWVYMHYDWCCYIYISFLWVLWVMVPKPMFANYGKFNLNE